MSVVYILDRSVIAYSIIPNSYSVTLYRTQFYTTNQVNIKCTYIYFKTSSTTYSSLQAILVGLQKLIFVFENTKDEERKNWPEEKQRKTIKTSLNEIP